MVNHAIRQILACPRCKHGLAAGDLLVCSNCGIEYPVVDGIPVLIDDDRSLFKRDDFVLHRDTTYGKPATGWKKFVLALIPSISTNLGSDENFRTFFLHLKAHSARPRVLIIGGAVEGKGLALDPIANDVELVETDVSFGVRTGLICDAHDLPFRSGTFDGVIAQAVLEHVVDPFRCVTEIERVLAPGGLVYAETPFMQQVHMGRHDFLRFSHLGHRRLFRGFAEIDSGAVGGPGTALAWSWAYFLRSIFRGRTMQRAAFAFGAMTGFYFKYFDYFIASRPGGFDAASCYYFLGSKSEEPLSDQELVKGYLGTF